MSEWQAVCIAERHADDACLHSLNAAYTDPHVIDVSRSMLYQHPKSEALQTDVSHDQL